MMDFIRVTYCDDKKFAWAIMYGDKVWTRCRYWRKAKDQVVRLQALVAAWDARERS